MFWGIQNIAFLLYASDIDFYGIDVSFLPYCFHLWSHTVGFRSTLCNAVSNTGLYKHNYFWSEGERGVKIEAWSIQCAKYCRTTAEFKRHYFKSMEEGCSNTTFGKHLNITKSFFLSQITNTLCYLYFSIPYLPYWQ